MKPHLSLSSKLAWGQQTKSLGSRSRDSYLQKGSLKKTKTKHNQKTPQNNNLLINLLLRVVNRKEGQNEEQDSDSQLTGTSI